MKHMQTPQLANFFRAIHLLQTNSTEYIGQLLWAKNECLGFQVLPDKLTIHGFGQTHRTLRGGPPLF
jgi:hypothetical protein